MTHIHNFDINQIKFYFSLFFYIVSIYVNNMYTFVVQYIVVEVQTHFQVVSTHQFST